MKKEEKYSFLSTVISHKVKLIIEVGGSQWNQVFK